MFIFFKRVNKTYKPKKKNSYVSIMTTDSMAAGYGDLEKDET